jgi:dTDP-3-amino-3,4,6-trideoxy-alpha-D-glucose transaminase
MINLNEFGRQWKIVETQVLAAVQRVGGSGRYILGPEVEQFETSLAQSWGVAHAVGVGNGMDALEIALRCLGLEAGQKVLTTPFSAFATTLAILRAGGVPVFVDVDDNANLDLDQARSALTRDRSIRFLLPVHLYGNPFDLEKLAALKHDLELLVVEDCAQAIGARHGGRFVGSVGQAAGTSFYPTKNFGALGDGGALLTNDAQIATRAKSLRNYGQSSVYVHDEQGLNSRLDELQAAILREAIMPNLEHWTETRCELAHQYRVAIHNPRIRILEPDESAEPVWHLFPLFISGCGRDALSEHLAKSDIRSGVHYPTIIPDQLILQRTGAFEIVAEPANARRLANSELSLPIHPFLEKDEVACILSACGTFQG